MDGQILILVKQGSLSSLEKTSKLTDLFIFYVCVREIDVSSERIILIWE